MDLSETHTDETMDIDPQTNEARLREFVLCSPPMSKLGQIFELLLLTEFTMDHSETYTDETMDIGHQSNTVRIWNLYCYSAT